MAPGASIGEPRPTRVLWARSASGNEIQMVSYRVWISETSRTDGDRCCAVQIGKAHP